MTADKNMIRKKIIAENLERVYRKNPPVLRDLEHMIERIEDLREALSSVELEARGVLIRLRCIFNEWAKILEEEKRQMEGKA